MSRECSAWFAPCFLVKAELAASFVCLVLIVVQIVGKAIYVPEYAQPIILQPANEACLFRAH
jgi:hypothetical protein